MSDQDSTLKVVDVDSFRKPAPANAISPTAPVHPFWVARYKDGTTLAKYDITGGEKMFTDIDQSRLEFLDIWFMNQADGATFKVTGILFHPDIMRLIFFYRTEMKKKAGVDVGNGSAGNVQKAFFGYQMTVPDPKSGEIKNYQCLWSAWGEVDESGAVSVHVEPEKEVVKGGF